MCSISDVGTIHLSKSEAASSTGIHTVLRSLKCRWRQVLAADSKWLWFHGAEMAGGSSWGWYCEHLWTIHHGRTSLRSPCHAIHYTRLPVWVAVARGCWHTVRWRETQEPVPLLGLRKSMRCGFSSGVPHVFGVLGAIHFISLRPGMVFLQTP